jgi:AcrR family transcriptional regulator
VSGSRALRRGRLEGTTVEAVASRAGLGKATFYRRYPNRGWMLAQSTFGWPLVIGGCLKAAYDLLLLRQFRDLRPPDEAAMKYTLGHGPVPPVDR